MAVRASLNRLEELVGEYDRAAETVLAGIPSGSRDFDAVSRAIELMRMLNTGNLEWRYVCRFLLPCSSHVLDS